MSLEDEFRDARRVHLAVDAMIMREIEEAIRRAAIQVEGQLLYDAAKIDQAVKRIFMRLRRELMRALEDGVGLQVRTLRAMLDEAVLQETAQYNPPSIARQASMSMSLAGPSLLLMGATVGQAEVGLLAVIREAIVKDWPVDQLAKRIRPFMDGASAFSPEELADLRRVPRSKREAARKLAYNANRIAVTEMANVAHDVETLVAQKAPMVKAMRWELSPVRGTQDGKPDECDVLAGQDFYGLGTGIYPVYKLPRRPHPHDRCWISPITRLEGEWDDPKPNPDLIVEYPSDVGLELSPPGMRRRSKARAWRVITDAAALSARVA